MSKFVAKSLDQQNALQLLQSFTSQDRYYMFVGDHLATDDSIADVITNTDATDIALYDNMLEGNRINPADVALMVLRNVWTSEKTYNQYSATSHIATHVIVEDGNNYNVYKCISNNGGSISTISPSGQDLGTVATTDGYIWKWMYNIAPPLYTRFATSKYIPYVPNSVVEASAIRGTIDAITVVDSGLGYTNYYDGALRDADIATGSNVTYYLPPDASSIADLYTNCILMITDPLDPAYKQFRTITSYSVGVHKQITVDSPFTITPRAGCIYEIRPSARVVSSYAGGVGCVGRALINFSKNSVTAVEILNSGKNYRNATAEIIASNVVNVSRRAIITPLVSPSYGHGGNIAEELDASAVGIVHTFSASNARVPRTNDFRQFGIIKNPRFDNVIVSVTSRVGTRFSRDETVVVYQNVSQIGTGTFNANTISSANSTFVSSSLAGEYVMVSNNTHRTISQISQVSNNTSLIMTTTASPAFSNAAITSVRIIGEGIVQSSNATHITVDNVRGSFVEGQLLYGVSSKSADTISPTDGVSINGRRADDLSSFIQASRLIGANTGVIVQDEQLTSPSGSAFVHSTVTSSNGQTVTYVTNVTGVIGVGTMTGNTSHASVAVSAKYNGDLAIDRGQIIYAETVTPITREETKSETIKVILEL